MSIFHLKYRPQKLSELDSVGVAAELTKVLSGEEVARSFLFAGPKGAGKTSAARIVARAVNCLGPDGVEPCGKCANCLEIFSGASLDIIEIDAASNRGIDDVRSLKDKAYLLPSKLKRKVFIVDEVHMLTKEAFNALLKLLEEPPKHTMFILCTTDPDKIPETVLSRLIRVDFRKGNREELRSSLRRIIKGEKMEIMDEVLDLVVAKSDGSFRNLQKMFNEIFIQQGKKIGPEEVKAYFEKKVGNYSGKEMEADLVGGRVEETIERLEKLAQIGIDFKKYREEMVIYFHQRVLVGLGEKKWEGLGLEQLEKWLGLLMEAGRREKETEISQLPLELAVIEMLEGAGPGQKPKECKKKEEEEKETTVTGGESVEEEWGRVLRAVKPYNHSVEAFLRATRPKELLEDKIVLEVYYQFHKDRLEEPKNREIVEKGLRQVFGRELRFECELSKGKRVVRQVGEAAEGRGDIYEVAKEIFG